MHDRERLIKHERVLFSTFVKCSSAPIDALLLLLKHPQKVQDTKYGTTLKPHTPISRRVEAIHSSSTAFSVSERFSLPFLCACTRAHKNTLWQATRLTVIDMIERWVEMAESDITSLLRCGLLDALSSLLMVSHMHVCVRVHVHVSVCLCMLVTCVCACACSYVCARATVR